MQKVPVLTILKDAFFKCLKNPILVMLCFVAWGTPYVVNYFVKPIIKNIPTNMRREATGKTLKEAFQNLAKVPSPPTNWQGVAKIISVFVVLFTLAILFPLFYLLYLPAYDNKKYSFSSIAAGFHVLPRVIGAYLVYALAMGTCFLLVGAVPALLIVPIMGVSAEQVSVIITEYHYYFLALSTLLYAVIFVVFSRWSLFPLFIIDQGSLENKSLSQSNAITHGNTIRTAIIAALAYYFPPFGMMAIVALYRFLLKHNSALLAKVK